MADFLATYGIDDKALAIGLKKIEGMAAQHAQEVSRKGSTLDALYGQTKSKIIGIDNVVKAVFAGASGSVGLATRALNDYAKMNSYAAGEVERFRQSNKGLWTDIGRDISSLTSIFDGVVSKARGVRDEVVDVVASMLSPTFGDRQSNDDVKAATAARREQEALDLVIRSRQKREEIDAERLSKTQGESARLEAAKARSTLEERRGLQEIAELRTSLEKAGKKDEADSLARSVRINARQTLISEQERIDKENQAGREASRIKIEAAAVERQAAKESVADSIQANAQRIFGLEASQRQIQIAETQLRYDKQIRDLAQDKALLEEDRARAAGLLAEQRDAELGILMAQKDAQKTGRSIAIGSSQDARQAFAPVLNEERTDRKMAQQKFDRMISELAKIRSNTGQTQVATYQ